jgi:serine phosphatase RsbU (regulator of sigma subunit)
MGLCRKGIPMSLFDRRPRLFRVLFVLTATTAMVLSIATAYRYGSGTTDENWFRNAPSRIYVVQTIPTLADPRDVHPDSIRAGDMLIEVAGTRPISTPHALAILHAVQDSTLDVTTYQLKQDRPVKYRVAKSALTSDRLRDLPPTAHVFDVIGGGASDRAGMMVGDLILRINGKSFRNVTEADSIMRQAQVGKTIDYEILRDNQILILHVTLATFGISLGFLVMFMAGFIWMGTGAFIGLRQPNLAGARLLGLAFVSFGYALSTIIIRPLPNDAFLMFVRGTTSPLAVLLSLPLWFHASHYFPKERNDLVSRRWLRGTAYLLTLITLVATIRFGNPGFMLGLLAILIFTAGSGAAFRKTCPPDYKRISRPLRIGGIAAGLFVFLFLLAIYVFEPKTLQDLVGFTGLAVAVIPPLHLYLIGRNRLLDIELRLRRSLQFGVAAILWRITTFVLFGWLLVSLSHWNPPLPGVRLTWTSIEFLDTPAPPGQQDVLVKIILMAAVVALTYGFWKLGGAGLELIAKKFHRTRYDYRRAAVELGDVMSTRLTMANLAKGIVEKLGQLMQLKRVGVLFFRSQKTCCCQEAYGFDGTAWEEFCINADREISEALQRFSGAISVEYLPPSLKAGFQDAGFLNIVPVRSKERLIGAILVGEKESESAFRDEDFEFLASAAMQASVAIENAFLYEELAEQERLKLELAIARRIQMESLPHSTPAIDGLDVAGISLPALEVGGDYFDYLNGDAGALTVVVGDVSGKGTSAALYMSKVQGIFRSLHGFGLAPRDLMVRANGLLFGDMEKKSFVTAIGALFDTGAGTLRLARAGHLPLYHFQFRARRIERILPRGIGLGLKSTTFFASEIEEKLVTFLPGDVFLFVTDGVTEARTTDGEQFGEQRLEEALLSGTNGSALMLRDGIIAAINGFAGTVGQHDDQTIVVVKII